MYLFTAITRITFLLLLLANLLLAGCDTEQLPSSATSSSSSSTVSSSSSSTSSSSSSTSPLPNTYAWTDNFDSFDSVLWRKFDNITWGNNLSYMNGYNVIYTNSGKMQLHFKKNDPNGPWSGKYHSGAEIASKDGYIYKYGRYSVRMKAARGSGLVSTFFLFRYEPWQEIDIEILGRDTTKIQINVFYNESGNLAKEYHTIWTNLGFDAAADFHTYTIEWETNHISWYADGVLLYTGTTNIPYMPQEVSMNIWNCNSISWAGALFTDAPDERIAIYDWVKYEPIGTY